MNMSYQYNFKLKTHYFMDFVDWIKRNLFLIFFLNLCLGYPPDSYSVQSMKMVEYKIKLNELF